ncbi:MAG: carbamoyltransferase HypF [Candidatus Thermofonsia Clade 1 bacterium]|uniref:Carbamoyltransferase n=1 Tax=Candidatus Thermofonsia Clade 1 bacterium TaxID=2364210 RepID=A0A2M8PD81_9CHLR|nr:MAG: carbamoyltransferase HypF [Candidatus Thermofonsia Clade 1 bacterium]PJF43212.1 MAG: carbamoyltransferase HypF [Candidatus Thermofonsia Clade 1 bacterium]
MTRQRLRLTLSGVVQGVGFRPFIYRLARSLALGGWIVNAPHGVIVEIEGAPEALQAFLARLPDEKPAHALITALDQREIPPCGELTFEIRHSQLEGEKTALILPDLATCADCLRELFDPSDRRYRYPFINCTHCGPRYSVILSLPYDRPNTTMRAFALCPACRAEYDDPLDRRFHAQPTACPHCGPQLAAWSARGKVLAEREEALQLAEKALRDGQIVALKGLGGFQLLCDARNAESVRALRLRKQRPEKPFAVMLPDLETAQQLCFVDEQEAALLTSAAAPIVLLKRRTTELAETVAPHNPYLGVMLPYTPLHHLLMRDLGFPIVATSGNLSGEPICIDEFEALARLGRIADIFLVHNRPIARAVDDSVACIALGKPLLLRRARGYAPLPVPMPSGTSLPPLIAVGAHQKNTLAIAEAERLILSQHIGDLENAESERAFSQTLRDLAHMHAVQPRLIVCDAHPDYLSTRHAEQLAIEQAVPLLRVQHHHAHALACMAENAIRPPFLAVVWDGTGYGTDGTIWGGEFLQVTAQAFKRIGTWRAFPLIGGEAAAREPRRSALGALWQMYGCALPEWLSDLPTLRAFSAAELSILRQALQRGLNAPYTSSVGRLFDAVASLLDLNQRMSFEGQAAMRLEFAALEAAPNTDESYPFEVTTITTVNGESVRIIDYAQVFEAIMREWRQGVSVADIARRFHQTLCAVILAQARAAALERVALCGGCFQNRLLLAGAVAALRRADFVPFWSAQVPPNDGGIAYGQAIAARRAFDHKEQA